MLTVVSFTLPQVGSLSWAIMPGKIMFRDVAYVTPDYTIRVQDGFLVFRWWRSYVPKDVSEDLSHSDTRLSLQVKTEKKMLLTQVMMVYQIKEFDDLSSI